MHIPTLKKGDTIAIVAPAKAIEHEFVAYAIQLLEKKGYQVLIGKHCLGRSNYFSGTMEERAIDLQWALDNSEIKAIICARGGYGTIQLMDTLDWSTFIKQPKWIVGFSDITVLHQYLSKIEIPSIHGTMPLNFKENSKESISSLLKSLEEGSCNHEWETSPIHIKGECKGKIIGGNLSVLVNLIGTQFQSHYKDKILFIEDVGEYLYALDRNLQQLKHAGVFEQINGLIVGDFANVKDTEVPFGKSLEEMILDYCLPHNLPVAFNFPGGHLNDNRAIVFGKNVEYSIGSNTSKISYV